MQCIVSNVERKRGANEEESCSLRNRKYELEGEISKMEKALHLEGGDLDATSTHKKELKESLAKVDEEVDEIIDNR